MNTQSRETGCLVDHRSCTHKKVIDPQYLRTMSMSNCSTNRPASCESSSTLNDVHAFWRLEDKMQFAWGLHGATVSLSLSTHLCRYLESAVL